MIKVTYVNREPRPTGFSIEGIFKLVKEFLNDKIEIHEYNFDPKYSRWKNVLKVGKNVTGISHITGDIYFLALGLIGKKTILTLHDFNHLIVLRSNPIKYHIFRYVWYALPLKYASLITVVSNHTKKEVMEFFSYPEEKIRVIYNPIKPLFKYVEKAQLDDKPRILQIGTGKHKNLTNLIEAVKDIPCHLDIVAYPDGGDIEKLKQYNISYTLYSGLSDEQVFERYAACDILFFASHYEGFGMPIIECQSVGRPVITSNFGAMKEVGNDSAVLVDPYDHHEIKEAVVKLISDSSYYQQIVALGLTNIKQFQAEVIADNYLKVYQELEGL